MHTITDYELKLKRIWLKPFYEFTNIFQQDEAPPYTSASTLTFLEDHGIYLFSAWSAQLTNINVMESLWLRRKMFKD